MSSGFASTIFFVWFHFIPQRDFQNVTQEFLAIAWIILIWGWFGTKRNQFASIALVPTAIEPEELSAVGEGKILQKHGM